MRKWILLVTVIALALGAMGVVAQDDLAAVDPSGTTIQYWHQYNSGAQLDTMNAFIADFNASNEWGITVEGTAQGNYGDIATLMNNSIVSGDITSLLAFVVCEEHQAVLVETLQQNDTRCWVPVTADRREHERIRLGRLRCKVLGQPVRKLNERISGDSVLR